ncbi:MAG: TonB-dependent receptor [Pseudomonadota bacterium]
MKATDNHNSATRPPLAQTAAALATSIMLVSSVSAQDEIRRGSASALLEEVVVTARKREEGSQDVPLSISAFNSDQISALKVRNLGDLAVGMPNVALDDAGTTRGSANFSIRGLGINSNIPSIDPTVGVFIDGVYMGINNGIIFDVFDLQSIEILRGPQGILFGRNVTGGAILLTTKKPPEQFEVSVKSAMDTTDDGGINRYLMGNVGGPLTDSLGAKVAAYYNDDEGGLENEFTGDNHGELEQKMVRPVLQWWPSETLELSMLYEWSETEGDGAAGQSHTNGFGVPGTPINNDRDSLDFSIDQTGFLNNETNLFIFTLNWEVGENGTITNIYGYRDYEAEGTVDIDSQPISLFHAPSWLQAEQFSNELRYNGYFADRLNLTTGIYYFNNEITYHERRNLLGIAVPGDDRFGQSQDGGGEYEVETLGVFAAVDYDLTDKLTLTTGIRYTQEEKDAKIASLILNVTGPSLDQAALCNVTQGTCPYDFVDDEKWDSWSPKVGFTYLFTEDVMGYTHWTRGFRSGGYNLRNTSGDVVNNGPGPFDEEQVDNYEIGFKSEFGRGRLNGALFYNEIKDMQREVNLSDPVSGVVQVIKNTADADILGVELEGTFSLTDSLLLNTSVGWLDPSYQEVFFDINGDGVVDDADKELDLPRAAEWTYAIGFNYDLEIGDWLMSSRINYGYRDESAYTDNNRGFILEQDILDAGIDFYSNDGHWELGIYGRNLFDSVKQGGDTQLPSTLGGVDLGGTFSPLSKGRIYGFQVTYNYF